MTESLEKRIDQLEKLTDTKRGTVFFLVLYEGDPKPTPEEWERLKREATAKNPGQDWYVIYSHPPEGSANNRRDSNGTQS